LPALHDCHEAVRARTRRKAAPDPADPDVIAPGWRPALGGASRWSEVEVLREGGHLDELRSRTFTLLDGHPLDLCLLLRDAARALGTRGPDGKAAPALDEATAAFAWVVRQVRLE